MLQFYTLQAHLTRLSIPLTPDLQDAGDSAALLGGVRLDALLDHAGRLHRGPGHCGHLLQVCGRVILSEIFCIFSFLELEQSLS